MICSLESKRDAYEDMRCGNWEWREQLIEYENGEQNGKVQRWKVNKK